MLVFFFTAYGKAEVRGPEREGGTAVSTIFLVETIRFHGLRPTFKATPELVDDLNVIWKFVRR